MNLYVDIWVEGLGRGEVFAPKDAGDDRRERGLDDFFTIVEIEEVLDIVPVEADLLPLPLGDLALEPHERRVVALLRGRNELHGALVDETEDLDEFDAGDHGLAGTRLV